MHCTARCRLMTFAAASLAFAILVSAVQAAEPRQGDFLIKDFRFHTGEMLSELKLHYVTIGDPKNESVLVLHGSNGSSQSMMGKNFAGELFGPGQALDANKYFLILPDSLGAGGSSKPSDGLRAKFPRYTYADAVAAQYRLLTEHFGIGHVKMIIGQSMGGMQAWLWGESYPDFMSILVPMGSQPTAMAGRNWMLRRMMIEMIKADPAYNNGNYTQQPPSFAYAAKFFSMATVGGTRALQRQAGTHAEADEFVDEVLAAPFTADANDYIYAYDASRDYDPSPSLEKIKAWVLAINAGDDERNPAELGITAREIKRVKNGRYYEIPPSDTTRGHGTSGDAKYYKDLLADLLNATSGQ
jgi:homoserine O-acetyltransferase/O-succinyltransferase